MKMHSAILIATALTGCAQDATVYPSLLPRAAEKQGFDEPAARALGPAVADPAFDAQLATIGAKLDTIVRGFDTDAGRADRAAGVTGARTVGSEDWVAAETALAALDDWRAQTSETATAIDDLIRARIEALGTPEPALESLRARAEAEGARQTARIIALGARLPTP